MQWLRTQCATLVEMLVHSSLFFLLSSFFGYSWRIQLEELWMAIQNNGYLDIPVSIQAFSGSILMLKISSRRLVYWTGKETHKGSFRGSIMVLLSRLQPAGCHGHMVGCCRFPAKDWLSMSDIRFKFFISPCVCGTITISHLVSGTESASRDISAEMGTGQGTNEPFF